MWTYAVCPFARGVCHGVLVYFTVQRSDESWVVQGPTKHPDPTVLQNQSGPEAPNSSFDSLILSLSPKPLSPLSLPFIFSLHEDWLNCSPKWLPSVLSRHIFPTLCTRARSRSTQGCLQLAGRDCLETEPKSPGITGADWGITEANTGPGPTNSIGWWHGPMLTTHVQALMFMQEEQLVKGERREQSSPWVWL